MQCGESSSVQHLDGYEAAHLGLNIVIVDDQMSARTMLRHVIEDVTPRLQVFDFGDSLEALAWCETNQVDLLLLDYRMPDMDGLEFARCLRRLPSYLDVPILLITIVGDEPIRQAALDAGVIDCLIKPIRPRELRARCNNLLQLRQHGEHLKQRVLSLEQRLQAVMNEVQERERETISRLARAVEYRHVRSSTSLERMSQVAGLIAEQLGLSEQEVRMIQSAAPLHDIGKIAIPDAVFLKRSTLNEEERAVMQLHPRIGCELLSGSQNRCIQVAALIALRHHERYDGSGYPDGLVAEAIPLEARIVAVADVFDALISLRAYKHAWTIEATITYLYAQRGRLFDPHCVDALIRGRDQLQRICANFSTVVARLGVWDAKDS
ncbi:MAG TPA: HD-GYP domain-containing protein [Xylella sp.]